MNIQIQHSFDPAMECILLLNRRYSQVPDMPKTIAETAEHICAKYGFPASALQQEIALISAVEAQIVEHLSATEQELQLYFASAVGNFSTLAFSLYLAAQDGIDFNSLPGEAQLAELRKLLCITLGCSEEQAWQISDVHSLSDFLNSSNCPLQVKWSILIFWQDPGRHQKRFNAILREASGIFEAAQGPLLPLLEQRVDHLDALFTDERNNHIVVRSGNATLVPSAMVFNAIGMLQNNRHSSGNVLVIAGILYQRIAELVEQYRNSSELIASGGKTIGDARRVEILKLLKERPLCNQELSDALELTAPTISHHMSCLVRDGFVSVSKRGNRIDYSLNRSSLQAFLEVIQATLL